jgi:hypothetical protein
MVSFGMDYVEFRIDYNSLRALNPPRIELHDGITASSVSLRTKLA